ncbi:hypothetical protein BN1723_020872, partial [Verticillium longisporum]
QKL